MSPKTLVLKLALSAAVGRGRAVVSDWIVRALTSLVFSSIDGFIIEWTFVRWQKVGRWGLIGGSRSQGSGL
jgi:hypothetical protein